MLIMIRQLLFWLRSGPVDHPHLPQTIPIPVP
jgi:hypothetical protein